MTAYQLPDDVGQNAVTRNGEVVQAEGSFPSGQKEGGKSLPVVLPKENYTLNIIDNYRFKTEVDRDLLGIPRITRPFNFLTRDDQFELSTEDWVYETSGINERPEDDSTQSARWTQLSETSAIYSPGPNGAISYNSAANSAQLTLSNNAGVSKSAYCHQASVSLSTRPIVRASSRDSLLLVARSALPVSGVSVIKLTAFCGVPRRW